MCFVGKHSQDTSILMLLQDSSFVLVETYKVEV